LQLIDQQHDGGATRLGGLTDGDQQLGKISFEVTAVSDAALGTEIETDLEIAVLHFDVTRETEQHAQATAHDIIRGGHSIQIEQDPPQCRREKLRQQPVLGRFDQAASDAALLSELQDAVQQNRLSDTAQADENEALGVPSLEGTLDGDCRRAEDGLAPGQLRRLAAGARCEGVADGVHLYEP
jgi:hypothetical protein